MATATTAGENFSLVLRRRAIPAPEDSLLTICARPRVPERLLPEVQRRVVLVEDWNALLTLAEEHGVGPLLYAHLTRTRIDVPFRVARRLRGLYARHHRCNEVILSALAEILDVLGSARIESIVLKGPALLAPAYGDIGLRPISDLDLLVAECDAVPVLHLLAEIGYGIDLPASGRPLGRHHHLHAATRSTAGVPTIVEIHRDALSADRGHTMTFDDARPLTARLDVNGRNALALEPHAMLWHLCRHLSGLWHPYRLIWVADIVGYAEALVEEIDWSYIRKVHPFVLRTLSLLHDVTPLPEAVLHRSGVSVARIRHDVCREYEGWPRSTALTWDGWLPRLGFVRHTIRPPDWWLRLNYGIGTRPMGRWVGSYRHLVTLGGVVWRRALDFLPGHQRTSSVRHTTSEGTSLPKLRACVHEGGDGEDNVSRSTTVATTIPRTRSRCASPADQASTRSRP